MQISRSFGVLAVVMASGLATSVAHAQDSVASTPGSSDALSSYNTGLQSVSYIVDLVPLTGSWGTTLQIGPIAKASLDTDPMFSTQILGSAAASADQLTGLSFASRSFALWTTPGAGVNPVANSAPGSVNVTGFDRQFGVGFTDLSTGPTNAIGAAVGINNANPARLYVTRTVGLASRNTAASADTATIALGAIDATGNLHIRADDFNSSNTAKVLGENIARIDLTARNTGAVNFLLGGPSFNIGADTAATTFLLNNITTTTNTPSAIPDTASTSPIGVILDFANNYRPNGGPGVTSHLASDITAHRGNPSFSSITTLGGVGTAGSLALSAIGGGKIDSINLFALNSTGGVVANAGATLTGPITDAASSATRNAANNSEFKQYLSQVCFRGGNGQVAIGFDSLRSVAIGAAVATNPVEGDFIAVARFSGTPSWTIAAHVGKTILNGPGGTSIGTLVSANPAGMSAPGADLMGNIYFVASYQPAGGGPVRNALIKAVNSLTGYRLERLLDEGQAFNGANSGRSYTVTKLTLADADSVASGTLHSSHILQPKVTGQNPTDPASPFAFGGVLVNATITYNNGGTPEPYQAVLFVGPRGSVPPVCAGDANGDGLTNGADLSVLLSQFGQSVTPGTGADFNSDGQVNGADLSVLLSNFGCGT